MKVAVADDVWSSASVDPLELVAVLRLCADRHVLLLSPSERALAAAWIKRQTDMRGGLQARLLHVLETNRRRASNLGSHGAQIVVVVKDKDWTRGLLTPPLAARLLSRPLKLLVENSRNDRAFLLMIAEPAARRELRKAIDAGWIEFEMGGGLQEILQRIRSFTVGGGQRDDQAWIELARLWVMFDRDADPGDRSRESKHSRNVLDAAAVLQSPWALAVHQLKRRAIENYVPSRTLQDWWCTQAKTSASRHARELLVAAFLDGQGLQPAARHSYNMKRGLLGDVSKSCRDEVRRGARVLTDNDLDPLFRGLQPHIRNLLASGGFDDVAAAFSSNVIPDNALYTEVDVAERRRLIGSIQDRM